MKKYKIGDRVRIVNKWTEGCHANPIMDKYRGTVMTIRNIEKTLKGKTCYRMKEDVSEHIDGWYWHEPAIAGLANNDKIVITTNGKETLARLYEGNKVIKTATAKCSPDDTFNFETGAKIAFDRLMGEKPEGKPKYYNGKIVCVTGHVGFTPGKVYEVVDGQFKDDNGRLRPTWGKMAELREYSGVCFEFIPFVE